MLSTTKIIQQPRQSTYQGALQSAVLTKYYLGDQIKNEMSWACGMCGGQKRCIQGFGEQTSWQEITWNT